MPKIPTIEKPSTPSPSYGAPMVLPKLEELAQKVVQITEIYFALHAEHETLRATPDLDDAGEEHFFQKVVQFSQMESEVNQNLINLKQVSDRDNQAVTRFITVGNLSKEEAAKQLGIRTPTPEAVQEQLTMLRNPIPKIPMPKQAEAPQQQPVQLPNAASEKSASQPPALPSQALSPQSLEQAAPAQRALPAFRQRALQAQQQQAQTQQSSPPQKTNQATSRQQPRAQAQQNERIQKEKDLEELVERFDRANQAIEAFQEHVNAVPQNDPERLKKYEQTKQALATEMYQAFTMVKTSKINELEMRQEYLDLQRKYDQQMQECAPIIDPKQTKAIEQELARYLREHPLQRPFLTTNFISNTMIKDTAMEALKAIVPKHIDAERLNLTYPLCKFQHQSFGEIETTLTPILYKFIKNYDENLLHNQLCEDMVKNYKGHEAGGGGNCLFHSLAYELNKNNDAQIDAAQLRAAIIAEMRDTPQRYSKMILARIKDDITIQRAVKYEPKNLDDKAIEEYVTLYLNYMERNGTWGGSPELNAFSNYFRRAVFILQTGAEADVTTIFPTNNPYHLRNGQPILIKNLNEGHFQALIPKAEPAPNPNPKK